MLLSKMRSFLLGRDLSTFPSFIAETSLARYSVDASWFAQAEASVTASNERGRRGAVLQALERQKAIQRYSSSRGDLRGLYIMHDAQRACACQMPLLPV